MRPKLRFLDQELLERIVAEARDVLAHLGMEIHNPEALALLADHGATVDLTTQRALFPGDLVDRALKTAAREFRLYGSPGNETHHFAGDNVYFTPGSAALYILDPDTGRSRHPVTADYVRYAKLVGRLPHIASQSTAMVPQDVPARDPGQLPALPQPAPLREAGGHGGVFRRGLRDHEGAAGAGAGR